MAWDTMPKILTDDVYCPYCKLQGTKQKFACEIHGWAYHNWYRKLQCAFSQPSPDKKQTGFFGKPKDN
jgi:hypothetical protein